MKSIIVNALGFTLAFLLTILAVMVVDVFVLGHVDEKWGGPWGNVQIGFYLHGLQIARSAVPIFLLGLVMLRRPVASLAPGAGLLLVSVCGVAAAIFVLSGFLKWLSLRVAVPSGSLLVLLGLLPGILAVVLLASCLVFRHRWQSS